MTNTTDRSRLFARAGSPTVYSEVADILWRYYTALSGTIDESVLTELLDPEWNGKSVMDGALVVESRDTFLTRMKEQGRAPTHYAEQHLTSLQVFFDDFAIARAEGWENDAPVTIFTLFQTGQGWRLASEASCQRGVEIREKHYNPTTAEADVLKVLGVYYQAVEVGDPQALNAIFDPNWHMKNLEAGTLYSERVPAFATRLEKPWKGYLNDRQVSDVQIISHQLAVVRIDKPTTKGVTVFTFFRLNGTWKIVDKAWSWAGL